MLPPTDKSLAFLTVGIYRESVSSRAPHRLILDSWQPGAEMTAERVVWSTDILIEAIEGEFRMNRLFRVLQTTVFLLVLQGTLFAQTTFVNPNVGGGATVTTPGYPPSFVNPNVGGGYTITTPGSPTTFVNPNVGGGATAITPGQTPSFINPNIEGGYTITTPGQPPTFVNPNVGGGATAITPGQPPTFISPTVGGGYTITTPGAE